MGYEDAASAAFEGRRIVALCGYDSRRCQSNQVCDVISSHHHTLYRTDGAWQVAP